MAKKLKPWPILKTEDEVDDFIQNNDLSEYEWGKGTKTIGELLAEFEARHKDGRVNLRLPGDLIEGYKASARAIEIPYQRLMRLELQKGLQALQLSRPASGQSEVAAKTRRPAE
jgi:predicted DNA binding CopG/RHH family protein